MGDVESSGGELDDSKQAALFVTCLVDQIMPEIGVATVKLLRRAGCRPTFPAGQTCCGQPFFNSGFRSEAKKLARRTIEVLEPEGMVVVPSGSCASMIRVEYEHLFEDEPGWRARAVAVAGRVFELGEFLVDQLQWAPAPVLGAMPVTYHDSCHMCRLLHIKDAPRRLLAASGHELKEMKDSEHCCGFGGLFSIKMPEVANEISAEKLRRANEAGVGVLVTSDPGCLMQMKGVAEAIGSDVRVTHLASLLVEQVG